MAPAPRVPSRLIKAYLPVELHRRLREYVEAVAGATASRIIREGIQQYVAQAERENYVCRHVGGDTFAKLSDQPFPPRRDNIPAGRPMGGGDLPEEQKYLTFRLPTDELERFYNCLYWRNEYLSHIVRRIVEDAIADESHDAGA